MAITFGDSILASHCTLLRRQTANTILQSFDTTSQVIFLPRQPVYGRGRGGEPFSGCMKSETGKKRPIAKIYGTRSRAQRGATGVKNGVKSGGFWQPLSQDVALCCKLQQALFMLKMPSLGHVTTHFCTLDRIALHLHRPTHNQRLRRSASSLAPLMFLVPATCVRNAVGVHANKIYLDALQRCPSGLRAAVAKVTLPRVVCRQQ
jgi:hypothetical protein